GVFVNLSKGSHEFNVNDELRGYQLKFNLPETITHTGALNNDATYSRATQDGWQIMANPYPSYYKIPQAAVGTGDLAHSTGTVYVSVSTTNATKTFETYNVALGTSSPAEFKGILAPSQAFYISTAATSTPGVDQLLMSASNRFHDVNKTNLKSAMDIEEDILRIKMVNDFGFEDEAVIAFREKGDKGLSRMDSEQRYYNGTNISYIYSMVEDTKAVINTLPMDMYNEKVDLGVNLKAGNHRIRIEGLNTLSTDYPILLEDKDTGVKVEMDANSEYAFTVNEATESNGRFVLHFGKSDVATDIDDKVANNDSKVKVYVENSSKLVVSCEWTGDKQVYLFALDGRMVSHEEFRGESYTKDLNLKPGIYVVKIIGDDDKYEQKVFVK
ncbi:MAG: T9SS type A sorting domain-containing protein, partial [Bacteroidales bacterium]|nr:T9SS type A sorting domain-containing protein [Bacteroidales bacterium]